MSDSRRQSRWWRADGPADGGLELLDVYDGNTRPAVRDAAPCVSATNPNGSAQAYFRIDRPHFLTNREVEISIEVLTDGEEDLRFEYDSTDRGVRVVPDIPGAFKCLPVRAKSSGWQRLGFRIADGRFRGALNGADFRIVCARPQGSPLFLRSAGLVARPQHESRRDPASPEPIELRLPSVAEPEVSIVIPVWNRLDLSLECLRALSAHTEGSYEVVVVDNGSTDGTATTLQEIPGLRLLRHDSNLGFAKACNAGAAASSGRYLVFLNNDTVPLPGWLPAMVSAIEGDARIGIAGSKLLYPETGEVQHAGMAFTADGHPYHPFRFQDADAPAVGVDRFVPAVTGACLLTRREIFERCGGFDERYLNGYEDLDFCLRVREAGYLILYRASSVLIHHESATTGRFVRENANLALFLERWLHRLAVEPPA